jgi:hypothetical protein
MITAAILVGIAVTIVAMILFAGLYTLWAGGDVSRTWSNRLMRYRVMAQFVAVLIIMAILFLTGGH